MWIWSQFPRQIASDLSQFHHRRIADWHKDRRDKYGDLILSSYELLELLEYMPEEGAFKTDAERGGRWPTWKQMLAEAANQGYRMHASYLTSHGVEGVSDTSGYEFVDPVDREARAKASAANTAAAAVSQERFEDAIGY